MAFFQRCWNVITKLEHLLQMDRGGYELYIEAIGNF